MTTRTTVYGIIFAGLTAWAFSSAALATEQDEMMEEDAPVSSTDQSGMPKKDTAGHEKKMQDQGGMKQGSSMDKSKTQKMEDDAPVSSTDQSGMPKKDTAGHEKMQDQGGMKQGSSMDKSKTQKMEDDAPISSTDQSGMEKKDSANTQQN